MNNLFLSEAEAAVGSLEAPRHQTVILIQEPLEMIGLGAELQYRTSKEAELLHGMEVEVRLFCISPRVSHANITHQHLLG